MKKRNMKLIITMVMIMNLIFGVFSICYAASPGDYTGTVPSETYTDLTNFGNKIATIIRNVGIVTSVLILMVLGIKYMLGSAEEKAEFKKSMIPYFVGAIMLFGASGIAEMFIKMAKQI